MSSLQNLDSLSGRKLHLSALKKSISQEQDKYKEIEKLVTRLNNDHSFDNLFNLIKDISQNEYKENTQGNFLIKIECTSNAQLIKKVENTNNYLKEIISTMIDTVGKEYLNDNHIPEKSISRISKYEEDKKIKRYQDDNYNEIEDNKSNVKTDAKKDRKNLKIRKTNSLSKEDKNNSMSSREKCMVAKNNEQIIDTKPDLQLIIDKKELKTKGKAKIIDLNIDSLTQ